MLKMNVDGKDLKVWTNNPNTLIDDNTLKQARLLLDLDFVKDVALMPDAHVGVGSTVGSVIVTKGAVLPASTGVDISCGMVHTELLQIPKGYFSEHPEKKQELYANIRRTVPSGFPCTWNKIPEEVQNVWDERLAAGYELMKRDYPKLIGRNDVNQLGTLGSGNHFIEICEDAEQNYSLVIHSGSRGIGNRIGVYFIRAAKDVCKNNKITLPHADLAYLEEGTQFYEDYLTFCAWASAYAYENRRLMTKMIVKQIDYMFSAKYDYMLPSIVCNHNFSAIETHNGEEVHVTRKGAVRAIAGDKVIIPGSMGARTYICEGLGNPESYNSSSHGAGRSMGRKVAKNTITYEEHKAALDGIVCDSSSATLDESPSAYKDIDTVMEAQKDLLKPIKTIKQILCVKGQE